MGGPFSGKLAEGDFAFKYSKFRMSLLRIGLPFVLMWEALEYAWFVLFTRNPALRFPWKSELVGGVLVGMFVSVSWWLLMREIAAWKLQDRERQR